MIRLSAALVVVGLGLLLTGAISSELPLVYAAIAVSVAAAVLLVAGVIAGREDIFGAETAAPGGRGHVRQADQDSAAVMAPAGAQLAGPEASVGGADGSPDPGDAAVAVQVPGAEPDTAVTASSGLGWPEGKSPADELWARVDAELSAAGVMASAPRLTRESSTDEVWGRVEQELTLPAQWSPGLSSWRPDAEIASRPFPADGPAGDEPPSWDEPAPAAEGPHGEEEEDAAPGDADLTGDEGPADAADEPPVGEAPAGDLAADDLPAGEPLQDEPAAVGLADGETPAADAATIESPADDLPADDLGLDEPAAADVAAAGDLAPDEQDGEPAEVDAEAGTLGSGEADPPPAPETVPDAAAEAPAALAEGDDDPPALPARSSPQKDGIPNGATPDQPASGSIASGRGASGSTASGRGASAGDVFGSSASRGGMFGSSASGSMLGSSASGSSASGGSGFGNTVARSTVAGSTAAGLPQRRRPDDPSPEASPGRGAGPPVMPKPESLFGLPAARLGRTAGPPASPESGHPFGLPKEREPGRSFAAPPEPESGRNYGLRPEPGRGYGPRPEPESERSFGLRREPGGAAAAGGPGQAGPHRPAAGASIVVIVPGVARYHRSDCILIRFLSDIDVESVTREAAEAQDCVPCRACQPDKPSADSP